MDSFNKIIGLCCVAYGGLLILHHEGMVRLPTGMYRWMLRFDDAAEWAIRIGFLALGGALIFLAPHGESRSSRR